MPRLNWKSCVRLFAGLTVLMLAAGTASAQKVPAPALQEILIKVSLLTFNDANLTGNYTVLHAKLSKPFRDQFPPERLKEVYKVFNEKQIDLGLIAAKTPVPAQEARIDDRGVLLLKGYFDTTPSRVNYDLGFIMSDAEWKLVRLNIDVKKPD